MADTESQNLCASGFGSGQLDLGQYRGEMMRVREVRSRVGVKELSTWMLSQVRDEGRQQGVRWTNRMRNPKTEPQAFSFTGKGWKSTQERGPV